MRPFMSESRVLCLPADLRESLDYLPNEGGREILRGAQAGSEDVEAFCQRQVTFTEDTTYRFVGRRDTILQLPALAVREIKSVFYGDEEVTDYEVSDLFGGQLYREAGWFEADDLSYTDLSRDVTTDDALRKWVVTYDAGFYGPNQDGVDYGDGAVSRDLPLVLEEAALGMACSRIIQTGDDVSVVREHVSKAAWWRDHAGKQKYLIANIAQYRRVSQA